MCVCSVFHVLCSAFLLLLVSTAVVRASSYMRAYGGKELWPFLRLRCDLRCPYGFETDIEGNYVCLCHDPCQNVRCFGRTRCVVELPKLCSRDYCRPLATCKDPTPPAQLPFHPSSQNGVFLADDALASTSSSSASATPSLPLPARCRQARTEAHKKGCRKQRVRWFYDDVAGSCRSFMGCKVTGNNFRGHRGCEKTCILRVAGPRKNPGQNDVLPLPTTADVSVTSQDTRDPGHFGLSTVLCSGTETPATSGCRKPSKRWRFDSRSGTCKKFRGCPGGWNNFGKKRHCKNLCLTHGRGRRKERSNHSRTANQ